MIANLDVMLRAKSWQEFKQKFSKNSNAQGGMLKLRFDWYIRTTGLPGTTLFWLPIAKCDHNTDKISKYDPENIKFFHSLSYFSFGNKLFSSFVSVHALVTKSPKRDKLSRAIRLPYLKILLVNPGYLLTLLLGLPSQ